MATIRLTVFPDPSQARRLWQSGARLGRGPGSRVLDCAPLRSEV
jgi:hypothetical protein